MMDRNYIKGLEDLVSEIHDLLDEVDEDRVLVPLEAFLRGVNFVATHIEDKER